MANNMIRFDGAKKMSRMLDKAYKEVPEIAEKVLKNNAEKGKAKAKRLAAVDTWFMHDHITTMFEPFTAYIHSEAVYSGYVEYGTRFMFAQPFMRPMMEWLLPQLKKDLTDAMEGTLR